MKKNKLRMKNTIYPSYFVFGALVLYLLFLLVPGVMGFYYSFTDWSSYSTDVHFVGAENFYRIFFDSSRHYTVYIKNTVIFTVVTIILKTVIALLLALLLTSGIKRFANLHRAIIFLPAVLPLLVVGLVFKSILHPSTGILNLFLRTVGLDFLAQRWLVDVDWALFSVIGVDTWKGVGYLMVILIAGLQAIPNDYYEAARIDGANALQALWHITLPLLMPAIMVVTVLNLLYGLKVFDIVWVLTNGGPGYATETVYTAVFKDFSKGYYGIATALSTMLFVIMVSFGYFVIWLMHKEGTDF
ncbi:MAG: sugar ABC transporter permease [Anaerolineae bacterium]|nr:sugar ABC transporter permease [Anaerolineae bacterium]MCB9105817.1 sugar ABC transporter permease [Anaerolineales bacterium]